MFDAILKAIFNFFRGSMSPGEVEAAFNKLAQESPEKLDWRNSIIDLLKLLKLDSSMGSRTKLWAELGNTETYKGTADQNITLHQQVVKEITSRGIKMPA